MPISDPAEDSPQSPTEALLGWYRERQRDLPWRRSRDPYAIWVSEIMLQQTRVETVVPYYERFLERFPDVAALARAELDEVLTLWSGLGYYRRARLMHLAARQIVASDGRIPDTLEGLRALPGVGDYTAAAVGSIAFGLVEPTLDGNVKRVVGRLLALEEPVDQAKKRIRARALELLDAERPGDSNQALMELGATVCMPRRPDCRRCPLEAGCLAAATGEPARFAPRKTPSRRVNEQRLLAVVRRGKRYLLFKRPDDSELLAGIWEFPWVERNGRLAEAQRALGDRYGGRWSLRDRHGSIRHAITFRLLDIEIHEASVESPLQIAETIEAAWLEESEIIERPHTSMVRKVLSLVRSAAQSGA